MGEVVGIIVWAVVGILFVWMVVYYGLVRGKVQNIAHEFEKTDRRDQSSALDLERQDDHPDKKKEAS